MKKPLLAFLLLASYTAFAQSVDRIKLIARAAALELKTGLPYQAPPGDTLSHNTSGYDKIMC